VSSENTIPWLNQSHLASLRALSKARGRDLVRELSGTFFSVIPERIAAMKSAAATGDARAFAAGAHKLKGSAACIGADRLAVLCDRVESMGDGGPLEGAATLIEQIEEGVEAVREAFAQERG